MRILKKSMAILLTVAMVLSLMSVSVFAADNVLKVYVELDKTTVGQGQDVVVTVSYETAAAKANFGMGGFTLKYNMGTATDISEAGMLYTTDEDNLKYDASDLSQSGQINIGTSAAFQMTNTKTAVAKFKITIPDDATPESQLVLTAESFGFNAGDGSALNQDGQVVLASTEHTATVKEAFKVLTATGAAQTASLGDTLATVQAKLAELDITVTGANDATGTLKVAAEDWTCVGYNADEAKEYTFVGTLKGTDDGLIYIGDGADDVKTVEVVVTVGKIAFDAAMAEALDTIGIKAVSADAAQTSMTAAEVLTAVTDQLPATVAISNNGKYASVANLTDWAAKDENATLNLTQITANPGNEANVVVLTATATPNATAENGANYTGTATIELTVTVIPAEITGATIKIKSGNTLNRKPVLEVTIPGIVPSDDIGKKVTATIEANDETGNKYIAEYTITGDEVADEDGSVTVEVEGFYLNGDTTQDAATMSDMGYKVGNTVAVVVEYDEATLIDANENTEYEFKVQATVSVGPGSITGGNSSAKKYNVEVAETENGTVEVDAKTAASGATVTITATPAEGYKVKSIAVVDAKDNAIEVTGSTFVMPAASVVVTVEFEEGTDEPGTDVPGEASPFEDVPASHWAADYISLLVEKGIVNGKSATTFDPDGAVTRAEFTKMITLLFGLEATATESAFVDCGAADWFTPYVIAASEAGIVNGKSATEFAPNDNVTREEACTILGRALNRQAASTELTFTDAASISDFAAEYVALLVELGLVNGYEDGSFAPQNSITRAEAAKIIAVAYELLNPEVVDEAPEADAAEGEAAEGEVAEGETTEGETTEGEVAEEATEETTEEATEETEETVAE